MYGHLLDLNHLKWNAAMPYGVMPQAPVHGIIGPIRRQATVQGCSGTMIPEVLF